MRVYNWSTASKQQGQGRFLRRSTTKLRHEIQQELSKRARRSILGRENSMCKGPAVGGSMMLSWNSRGIERSPVCLTPRMSVGTAGEQMRLER